MAFRPLWLLSAAGIWLAGAGSAPAAAADLRILLPLYSYPTWYDAQAYLWDDVAAAAARAPIVAIVNPDSGPGGGPPNDDYAHGLADLGAAGLPRDHEIDPVLAQVCFEATQQGGLAGAFAAFEGNEPAALDTRHWHRFNW